jgi:hypothetical protein
MYRTFDAWSDKYGECYKVHFVFPGVCVSDRATITVSAASAAQRGHRLTHVWSVCVQPYWSCLHGLAHLYLLSSRACMMHDDCRHPNHMAHTDIHTRPVAQTLTQVVRESPASFAQAALQHRPGTFSRPTELLRDIVAVGADGLFTAEGQRWKRYRRLTAPHFR